MAKEQIMMESDKVWDIEFTGPDDLDDRPFPSYNRGPFIRLTQHADLDNHSLSRYSLTL